MNNEIIEDVKRDAAAAATEVVERSRLEKGQILVVGCSSSEILGECMGTESSPEVGKAVFDGIMSVLKPRGIFLAAQCCEHLNRAIIIEREAVKGADIVSVIPKPKAGGSFATAAYCGFEHPVAVEELKADAGMDIGGTLIGMHLKRVAVPLHLNLKRVGEAVLTAARTRPKLIGGVRAVYDENLE